MKPISQIAKEVIRGDWGNGSDRKARLEKAGYNYAQVQAEVNRLMNGGGSSSSNQVDIDAIARRVIRGDFGNGGARQQQACKHVRFGGGRCSAAESESAFIITLYIEETHTEKDKGYPIRVPSFLFHFFAHLRDDVVLPLSEQSGVHLLSMF